MNVTAAPLTPLDGLALFGFAAPASLLVGACMALSAWLYRRYEPLRARNVPNLFFMSLAGLVHLWATAVVVMRALWPRVYAAAPLLWTPWLEYVAGMGVWAAFLMMRPIGYSFVFKRRMRRMSPKLRSVVRVLAFLVLLAPALVLALVGTFRPPDDAHERLGQVLGRDVERPTWYTVFLGVWLALMAAVALAALVFISCRRRYRTKGSEFAEVPPLRFALAAATAVLVLTAILRSLPELSDTPGLRAAVVILFALMHAAVTLRYLAQPLWRALRRDQAYADRFRQRWLLPEVSVPRRVPPADRGHEHLLINMPLLAMFLLYCRMRVAADDDAMRAASAYTAGARRVRRMVDVLGLIQERHNRPHEAVPLARQIIHGYLTVEDLPGQPPEGVVEWQLVDEAQRSRAELFDGVRDEVVQELHSEYWDAFAAQYHAVVEQWREDVEDQRRILGQEGLLNPLDVGVHAPDAPMAVVARHYSDSEDDSSDSDAPPRRRLVPRPEGDVAMTVLSDDVGSAPARRRSAPEGELTRDLFEYACARWGDGTVEDGDARAQG